MRRFVLPGLVALALSWAVAGAARAEDTPAAASPAPAPRTMLMSPGDEVKVLVMGYSAYSGTFGVDVAGNLNLPGVGKVNVEGLDSDACQDRIRTEVWKMLRSEPPVTIEATHRVSVLGAVRSPGVYLVDGTERISELLARAGGATESAAWSHTRITRGETFIKKNMGNMLKSGATLTELGLQPGDVVYIPTKNPLLDWRNWSILVSGLYVTVSLIDRIQGK